MALFISDEEDAAVTNYSETELTRLIVQGSNDKDKINFYRLKTEDEPNATKIISESNLKADFKTKIIE